jgi:Na+/H+ antiporter NhaC
MIKKVFRHPYKIAMALAVVFIALFIVSGSLFNTDAGGHDVSKTAARYFWSVTWICLLLVILFALYGVTRTITARTRVAR